MRRRLLTLLSVLAAAVSLASPAPAASLDAQPSHRAP